MNNTIFIYDGYGEVIERFNDPQEMYAVLTSRYKALQKKRKIELRIAFWRGAMIAGCVADAFILLVYILNLLTK